MLKTIRQQATHAASSPKPAGALRGAPSLRAPANILPVSGKLPSPTLSAPILFKPVTGMPLGGVGPLGAGQGVMPRKIFANPVKAAPPVRRGAGPTGMGGVDPTDRRTRGRRAPRGTR